MTWNDPEIDVLDEVVSYSRQLREAYRNPIGTADNPYVVWVPSWYVDRCSAQNTTPQEVYDREFANTSFRHGVVKVIT